MQDEVNTKVVAIMIKGGKISAEVLKKGKRGNLHPCHKGAPEAS